MISNIKRKHVIISVLIKYVVLASLTSFRYPYLIEVTCLALSEEVGIFPCIKVVDKYKLKLK